jgi:hypothetical protein
MGKDTLDTKGIRGAPAKKAHMVINLEGFNSEVDIRYERMNSKDIKEERKVIRRDGKGRTITYKTFIDATVIEAGMAKKCWATEENEIVPKEELRTFQMIDGVEREVKAFDRTESVHIAKAIPADALGNFLTEYVYEVWAENQAGLYKLAEWLESNGKIAVGRVVLMSGSFTEYLGLFKPVFMQGKFVLEMYLVLKKKEYKHLLDISTALTQAQRPIVKDQAKGLELLSEVML